MSSADLVQRSGWGLALQRAMKVIIASMSAFTEVFAPRLIFFSTISVKKFSTLLIHDDEIGVKCMCQRGRLAKRRVMILVL